MGKTYHLSEKELLDLGFSKVATRALRYMFASIGEGETPDLTLVEVNEILKDLAYTPSAVTLINTLSAKINELQAQLQDPGLARTSYLTAIEKRFAGFQMESPASARIAILEKRMSDLEKRYAAGA